VSDYQAFLHAKASVDPMTGLDVVPALNAALMPFQHDITAWALRRGRAAIFADCGMGKTLMQLDWAHNIPGRVLILTPLAVAAQTVREAAKFGIDGVVYSRTPDTDARIVVTNYEMLDRFSPDEFAGVVLDESSILKAFDGKTRTKIIETFAQVPYRLACTATPAPNDYMELGNHAEFLSVMSRTEMLSMFFVHDGGETQQWRLKGHAEAEFWKWLCSWAVMIRKPSDLGYDDGGFALPEMVMHDVTVRIDEPTSGFLFPVEAQTLQDRIRARRETVEDRVAHTAAIVNGTDEPFVVWCNLNSESDALVRAIPGAVEVRGSDSLDAKEERLRRFSDGGIRVLVTKPSIAGHGLNWQHCANMAFVGLSDSYEEFYQAVRRCWRFGQLRPVNVYTIAAETEGAVVANIKRKEADAERMAQNMIEHMHDLNEAALHGASQRFKTDYKRDVAEGKDWTLHLGDCVEVVAEIPSDSVDFTVYSPPFASLYTYSASDRDMGNCKDDAVFMEHYRFLVRDLLRVTKPGRLLSFHCMNLPTSKTHFGYIGIRDFRGELIRLMESEGWIYHSEVCIWKDPVTAMQRTKALGLLHKQLTKDSCMSRQGVPDYLVTVRKPGENMKPVAGPLTSYVGDDQSLSQSRGSDVQRNSIDIWQRYASPVWMDINPSDTLQFRSAREQNDERHICPLQLQVITRALDLWSNPGDLVLSPFAGIGSEGYVALQMGRRFVGAELKESYWKQAAQNLLRARQDHGELFATDAA